MRHEYCTKDNIYISYSADNVCFENTETAEAILISNDGEILDNNFDAEKTEFFMEWFQKIYRSIVYFRTLDIIND